jgi:hypothetical protein
MRAPYFLLVVLQSVAQVLCAATVVLSPNPDAGVAVAISATFTIMFVSLAGTLYKRSL